jgi:hypothetical protein
MKALHQGAFRKLSIYRVSISLGSLDRWGGVTFIDCAVFSFSGVIKEG